MFSRDVGRYDESHNCLFIIFKHRRLCVRLWQSVWIWSLKLNTTDLNTHVKQINPYKSFFVQIMPCLPVACFSVAATVHGDELFVSGGITDDVEDSIPTNYLRG